MTSTATAVPTDDERGDDLAGTRLGWLWIAAPALVLALAAFAWLYEGRGVTFFIDEWEWIIGRHSPNEASLFEPFNNHWMTVPIGIHQVLYRVVGIDSHVPYRVVILAVHLSTAGLLFTYLRRRISSPLALAGCAVFAFYGYAWTITLWPISLGWAIATGVAVAAFLLVHRETRSADTTASALLLVAVASTSVAIAFVVGLAAELAMRRAWRRLWIVVVPVVAYGIWFIAYGSGTSDYGSPGAILRFVEKLLAQTTGTLLGVQARGAWAHITLVVVGAAFVTLWFVVGRPVTPRLVGLVVALGTYSFVLAVARASFGVTTWYSYPSAVLVLLLFGELLRGRVAAPPLTGLILVVAVWSLVWNLGEMRGAELVGGGAELRRISRIERAELLAVDLSADRVPPSFKPENFFLRSVTAGAYFEVEREYGTPAYTVGELRDARRDARRAADKVILRAMGIKAASGFQIPSPACITGAVQRVTSAVVLVEGGEVRIGVFDTSGVEIGRAAGPTSRIDLPPLGDPDVRWVIRAQDGARVCTLPGSAGGLT